MTFGQRVKQLRQVKGMPLRDLTPLVGVGFTYLSKVENGRLDFGDALEADADELLLLAKKIPESLRRRVIQRPDVFRKLASLDDDRLDKILEELADETPDRTT